MRAQLLFQRIRTLTPGGHPGGGVSVVGRGDGALIRVSSPAGDWYEVFLPTVDVAHLVEMLTENPALWGGGRS